MKAMIVIMSLIGLQSVAHGKTVVTAGSKAKAMIQILMENGIQEDIYSSYGPGVVAWSLSAVSCFSRSNTPVDPDFKYFGISEVNCSNIALGRTASRMLFSAVGNLPGDLVDCALGGQCGFGDLDIECKIDTRVTDVNRFSCRVDQRF